MSRPWSPSAEGLRLSVRLTPRGGRDALDGLETLSDGRVVLKARVRAAPTEGEANAALLALLSRLLELPKSRVTLLQGGTARIKTIGLQGEAGLLQQRLDTLLSR